MPQGKAIGEYKRRLSTFPMMKKVIRDKGSKRVMLKNMQEAKFNKVLIPISNVVLDPAQQSKVSFEAFFHSYPCT